MLMKFRPQPSVGIVSLRLQRSAPLAACLATALGLGSISTPSLADTLYVQNCNDSGSGSLRDIIDNFAQTGDTVDLSLLPTPAKCNMVHSTITLTSGEIDVKQDDLKLQGPTIGTVAISGNHASRVFFHKGSGTLSIDALTTQDGFIAMPGKIYGGCIRSLGNVNMSRSTITGCVLSGPGIAYGGGIHVAGALNLLSSTISGNQAQSGMRGSGGGIFAKSGFVAKYSTISQNQARTYGGGVFANDQHTIGILNSTINGNESGYDGGGLHIHGGHNGATYITNGTISENTAYFAAGIKLANQSANQPVTISNTTVAFNHGDDFGSNGAAIVGDATITLQSSIVAKNTVGPNNAPLDIALGGGSAVVGADNLIIVTNTTVPSGTLKSDPKLGPLQFNGGATQTHALLPGSPAIGKGNNSAGYNFDQRGHGYPRTSGASASADIGAFQFDSIFAADFE